MVTKHWVAAIAASVLVCGAVIATAPSSDVSASSVTPLDESWGGDGTVEIDDSVFPAGGPVVPAADGSLFLFEQNGYGTMSVAHLTSAGNFDVNFDVDGVASLVVDSPYSYLIVRDAFSTADGGVLALVDSYEYPRGNVSWLVKFALDGAVDPNFGGGAPIEDSATLIGLSGMSSCVYGSAIGETPAGDLVVVNRSTCTSPAAYVAELTADGVLISDFATSGVATIDTDFGYHAQLVAVRPDGALVVGVDNQVVQLNADGSVDTGFSPFASEVSHYATVMLPDGRLAFGSDDQFHLADGEVDESRPDVDFGTPFEGAGPRFTAPSADGFLYFAYQPDGDDRIGRVTPDGSLDTSYGGDGAVQVAGGAIFDLQTESYGTVMVGSFTNFESSYGFTLSRLAANPTATPVGCALPASSPASVYEGAVTQDHPLAFWPLTVAAHQSAVPDIMNRIHGNSNAGVSFGISGPNTTTAAHFSDTSDGIDLDVQLSGAGCLAFKQYSVEAWVKTSATDTARTPIVSSDDFNGLVIENGVVGAVDSTDSVVGDDIADGLWHHVVFVGGAKTEVWIDDERVALLSTAESSANLLPHDPPTLIAFQGDLADVAFYTYPLTSSQIAHHWTAAAHEVALANPNRTFGRPPSIGTAGDPVDVATGNMTASWMDIATADGNSTGLLVRSYNSVSTAVGLLGTGWQIGFEQHVDDGPATSKTFVDADGRNIVYDADGTGGYLRPTDAQAELEVNLDGSSALTFDNGQTREFDTAGRLHAVTDWDEQGVVLDWSGSELLAVESLTGSTLDFTYTGGRLTEVSSDDGRTVEYTFDTNANLATVTDPADNTTLFTSDTDGLLTAITDPTGVVTVTSAYDEDRRVTSQTSAGEAQETFEYDEDAFQTTVTNTVTGEAVVYGWDPDGRLNTITDPSGAFTTRSYDDTGALATSTTRGGAAVGQDTDEQGFPLTVVASGTGTTTYTYDSEHRVISKIVDDGVETQLTTTYAYDGSERAPSSITTDAGTTFIDIVDGLVESTTDPDGVETSYTYDAQRHVTSITNGADETTTYTYDTAGRILTITSPLDAVQAYTYDDAGRILTATAPDGGITTKEYDDAGRLVSVEDPEGGVTTLAYDVAGRLTTITDPNDGTTAYAYDGAGRRTSVTDAESNVTTYTYDILGRVGTITDPVNRTTSYSYNADGDVTSSDGPAGLISTEFDDAGRPTVRTDAGGRNTTITYDALGRTATVTAPGPAVTTYTYDATGRLTTITDPRDGTTNSTFTDAGRPSTATDPAGVVTTTTYDAAGRTSTVDVGESTTAYTYDADGHIESITSPEGLTTSFTYDLAGHVLTSIDPAGVTTTNTWDLRGQRLTTQIEGQGATTFTYDDAGNVSTVTDPLGAITSWLYDGNNSPTTRTNDNALADTWTYTPDGQIESHTDPLHTIENPNRTTTYTFGDNSLPATSTDPTGRTASRTYDNAGLLTEQQFTLPTIDDPLTLTYQYGYDPATGRKLVANDPTGATSYTYTPAGDLETVTRRPLAGVAAIGFDGASTGIGVFTDGQIDLDRPEGASDGDLLVATAATPDAVELPYEETPWSDDFTGTDADPWGAAWTTTTDGTATIDIASNRGEVTVASGSTGQAMFGSGTYAGTATATFVTTTANDSTISFWLSSSGTWSTVTPGQMTEGLRLAIHPAAGTATIDTIVDDEPITDATVAFTVAASTEYNVELDNRYPFVAAKIWADTDPEPDTWTLTTTSEYVSGAVAAISVSNEDTVTTNVEFDNFQLGRTSQDVSDYQISDTFDAPDDASWNDAWTTSNAGAGVVDIQANSGRLHINAGGTAARAVTVGESKEFESSSLYATVNVSDLPDGEFALWLRASTAWETSDPDLLTDGYRAVIDLDDQTASIERVIAGGAPVQLATTPITIAANHTYGLQFVASGSKLGLQLADDPEAYSPLFILTTSDAQFTDGHAVIVASVHDSTALDTTIDDAALTTWTTHLGDDTGTINYGPVPLRTPDGWTEIATVSGANITTQAWYHIAASDDPAAWTFNNGYYPSSSSGTIAAYHGVDTSNPISEVITTDNNTASTVQPVGGHTSATSGQAWLAIAGSDVATSYTPPDDTAERTDNLTDRTPSATITLADRVLDTDSTDVSGSFTSADSAESTTISILTNPASVDDPRAAITRFEYDTAGRRVATTFPDGTSLVNTYDSTTGRLSTVTPGQTLADTFTDNGAGGLLDPTRWTTTGDVTPTQLGGNADIDFTTTGQTSTMSPAFAPTDNIDVSATITTPTSLDLTAGTADVTIRSDTGTDSRLTLRLDSTATTAELVETVAGVDNQIGTVAVAASAGATRVRIRADGSSVTVKSWDPSQPEPITWGIDTLTAVTDPGSAYVKFTSSADAAHLALDDVAMTDLSNPPAPIETYSYDDDGRLTERVSPDSTITWAWTNGQLTHYTQDLDGTIDDTDTALTYDTSGRIATDTTDTVQTTYTYDLAGQLLETSDGVMADHWTYDSLGRRTSSDTPAGTITYTYDDASELESATCITGPCTDTEYDYDLAGRRITETQSGSARDYTYDPAGQLTGTTTTTGADVVVVGRTYDAEGQLRQLATNDPSSTTSTALTWDPVTSQLMSASASSGTHTDYATPGLTLTAGVATSQPETWMGTQGAQTDAFGATAGIDSTFTLGYRGEIQTEDGLIYLRNRTYDPTTGQFLTTDPLRGVPGTTTIANPYHYADNNPINKDDPLGLMAMDQAFGNHYPGCAGSSDPQGCRNSFTAEAYTFGCTAAGTDGCRQQSPYGPGLVQGLEDFSQGGIDAITEGVSAPFKLGWDFGNQVVDRDYTPRYTNQTLDGLTTLITRPDKVVQACIDDSATCAGAIAGGILLGKAATSMTSMLTKPSLATTSVDEVFHYTSGEFVDSISANGLRPGAYATPNGSLSPLQAQIDLALPPNTGLRDAVMRVDIAGLQEAGYDIPAITQVTGTVKGPGDRIYTMPGGGYEMKFPYAIPPEFIKVVTGG